MNNWAVPKLLAILLISIFLIGCIPDDSQKWSQDGSVGLMRIDGALYLVDGKTSALTVIEKDKVQSWPDISRDGNWIAYSKEIQLSDLEQGLKLIGPGQARIIENYAAQMTKKILANPSSDPNKIFPELEHRLILDENWIIRYVCEKANKDVLNVLPKKAIETAKAKPLSCCQIVLVNRKNLAEKRIVSTNLLAVRGLLLAPNYKSIAYLVLTSDRKTEKKVGEYSLCVTPLSGDAKVMLIDSRVAFGYCWRPDSKAIAYWRANAKEISDNEPTFGELKEVTVADKEDHLLAMPAKAAETGNLETHVLKETGSKIIVGSMFSPWMKAVYGFNGRIFFSSLKMSLPSSALDEAKWSLFCYDPVVGSISDVLPASVSAYMGTPINSFEISNDGTRILLPIEHNRFVIFEFGKMNMQIPIAESEGFGDKDVQMIAPAWKNGDIACLVDANSHFLKQNKSDKQALVVLGTDGNLKSVLSKTWDPNILSALKENANK